MSVVRVSFKKVCSDDNYGSETAEVSLELDEVERIDDESLEQMVAGLLAQARRQVFDELRNSPSMSVRRRLEYPKPATQPAEEDLEELPL